MRFVERNLTGRERECMERSEGLEGRGEKVRSIKERSGEVREGSREVNEEKGKERVQEWQ